MYALHHDREDSCLAGPSAIVQTVLLGFSHSGPSTAWRISPLR